ncbi:M1 family aminopeptidase, partial [Gilvimarinus sp. SDUM040013]|uniref:M1 family aminopeptidase n=1 Tax=Gilvimarinus gilvus TaxID=3058038 RepID=UPI002671E128
RTVKRIEDVTLLRTAQFAEDAGPMAHPVRPASFIEISNFYTLTVYEKGCEVVRMLRTLLGADTFRKGSDLYFERHDGQAVTTDDFVQAMADVSGRDMSRFKLWYSQSGTPQLSIT